MSQCGLKSDLQLKSLRNLNHKIMKFLPTTVANSNDMREGIQYGRSNCIFRKVNQRYGTLTVIAFKNQWKINVKKKYTVCILKIEVDIFVIFVSGVNSLSGPPLTQQ